MKTQRVTITGQVQGVGFRPFIYRLAHQHGLKGHVSNHSGEVIIIVLGEHEAFEQFTRAIIEQAPPLAKPRIKSIENIETQSFVDFSINRSQASAKADIHLPPDFFTCDDCLEEISNPDERRYQYPFTNCTQCGPRYTLIESLPYDRPNTSMKDFILCPACQQEYSNPLDRRFHAQPLACAECGPALSFKSAAEVIEGNEASLIACIDALTAGKIIAVKGVGGYHLICDAQQDDAIRQLRERKHRPDKPLAVMFPPAGQDNLDTVRDYCEINEEEAGLIQSAQRPIVLVKQKQPFRLSKLVAPGLNQLGVFLPYSPLHHLLLTRYQKPLIATSGNISGEPVITENQQAQNKLSKICDDFLHHNRPILRPADDSVKRIINRRPMIIRGGRGLAPMEFSLPGILSEPVIAVGGHLKNTVTLAWDDRVVISPHISDLDSKRGTEVFQQVIQDLQKLYQVKAQQIIHDAHPDYFSSRWALAQRLKTHTVWHHHAHAGIVAGQYPDKRNWLMFCWDGVGLGQDNTLWGGETFYGHSGNWQRVASFKPFFLPGADKAGREPWRSAYALRWESGSNTLPEIENASLAYQAWQKKLNCPQSTAAGRLFDAAANMILGIDRVSYEGQGPMQLEAIANNNKDYQSLPVQTGEDIHRYDWSVLLDSLLDQSISQSQRAAFFHNSLANNVTEQIIHFNSRYDFDGIGLSGGVFQNKRLVETIQSMAQDHGFEISVPSSIPINDGGLSYGQIIEYLRNKPKETE